MSVEARGGGRRLELLSESANDLRKGSKVRGYLIKGRSPFLRRNDATDEVVEAA